MFLVHIHREFLKQIILYGSSGWGNLPRVGVTFITTSLISLTGNHGLVLGNHPLLCPQRIQVSEWLKFTQLRFIHHSSIHPFIHSHMLHGMEYIYLHLWASKAGFLDEKSPAPWRSMLGFIHTSQFHQDWETWIRVTASLEQLWTRKVPSDVYHQHLPEFLQAGQIRSRRSQEMDEMAGDYGLDDISMVIDSNYGL